jgi:hypothetical protein
MNSEKRVIRNFLMIISLVSLTAGCSKTGDLPDGVGYSHFLKVDSTDSTMDTTYVDSTLDSTGVDTVFFIGDQVGDSIQVYKKGCWYGVAYEAGGYPDALTIDASTGELVTEGFCTIDATHLRLERGTIPGSVGPAYFFRPTDGPATPRYLRLKVRNVIGAVANDYNVRFKYHPGPNVWTWSGPAGTYFDIQEPTSLPVCN